MVDPETESTNQYGWATVADVFDPANEFAPYAVKMANGLLYQLSGEKFQGVRSVTEYYGKDVVSNNGRTTPALIGGEMYNLPSSSSARQSNAMSMYGGGRKLKLRHTPVRSVDSVSDGGRVLSPDVYQLRNSAFLVRKDGVGWTFSGGKEIEVTYTYGAKPPELGRRAAIRLANEFILAESDDDRCALPQRVTAVTRQNVSVTVLDPQEFLDNGKTGIYAVDLFIKAYNPTGAKKKTKLVVPGNPHAERIN